MSTIWMILGGCLIGLGMMLLLATVLLEHVAVKRLREKYRQMQGER